MSVTVRSGEVADTVRLQQIEIAAGERFREVGLDDIAAHEPFSDTDIAEYLDADHLWVAELDGEVVGYVAVDVVDGNAHVEQVSVDPAHQRAGIGRMLMARVDAFARDHAHAAVTLTTFTHVAWNAPLYAHLGFTVMTDDDIGAELRALVVEEAAEGLDPSVRVCMRKLVAQ